MTSSPIPVHHADDQAFNYYGRWQRGPAAATINSLSCPLWLPGFST